jgi:hypothetical protein
LRCVRCWHRHSGRERALCCCSCCWHRHRWPQRCCQGRVNAANIRAQGSSKSRIETCCGCGCCCYVCCILLAQGTQRRLLLLLLQLKAVACYDRGSCHWVGLLRQLLLLLLVMVVVLVVLLRQAALLL